MKKIILMAMLLATFSAYAADSTVTELGMQPPRLTGSIDGSVLTVANGDLGNADTSYLYFNLLRSGFNSFSMQYTITATTLTVEYTNDLSSVSDASATWTDGTLTATDGAASSITATGTLTVSNPLSWGRVRIKRVTTNATNALQIRLSRMRLD